MKICHIFRIVLLFSLVLSASSPGNGDNALWSRKSFSLNSPSFSDNASIPKKYTCQGENLSTPLTWKGAPEGTKSLALIMEDPDAQPVVGYNWIHWVAYNIPPTVREIPEGLGTSATIWLPGGGSFTQGITSWKKPGYGGPCPPRGTGVHKYAYVLYALNLEPGLPPGLTKDKLLKAIGGNILAETRLAGTYTKD